MNSTSIKVACSNCNLRELCMPLGLNESEMERVDEVVATRRKVARGDNLFRNGDKFSALYACLLYTSPSPRDAHESRMPSSA